MRRLLHDVAELAGELELARAVHAGRLDEEDLAADARPREARGHARLLGALGHLAGELRGSEELAQLVGGVHATRRVVTLGDLHRDAADDARHLTLEVADAGLARPLLDDLLERAVGDVELRGGEPVLLELLGQEVLARDRELLAARVARDLEDLHAVAQRRGDRVGDVGRRDEHHVREVVRDLEVVVGEGVVLLGVEHLEQRRARVAAEVVPDLVDLIHHEDGVDRVRLLHALDDLAGQGADVRAAVTADGGLVVHAAERHAHELAAERAGDAAPERRLADAGGAEQAEDGALLVLLELAHREKLEDALLDLLEAVVVLVEDLAHGRDVHVVGRGRRPRQVEDPVEVGAHHRVLGRPDLHRAQAPKLLLRDRLGLAGQSSLDDALLEPVEVALVAVVLAELLLDGLELLAQHVLALVFAHLLLDLGVDALAHLQDLELAREQAQHLADALLDLDRLDELRLLLDGGVEVGRHEVGERAGGLDGVDERARLARQLGHELDDLLGDVAQAHRERLGLDVLRRGLLELADLRLEVGRGLRDRVELDAHQPLQDERVVARAVLERLEHARRAADRVEVVVARVVGGGVALGEDRDDRAGQVVDVLDERDRLLAADVERGDGAREEHGVADRQDRKLVAELHLVVGRARRRRGRVLLLGHGSSLGGNATETVMNA